MPLEGARRIGDRRDRRRAAPRSAVVVRRSSIRAVRCATFFTPQRLDVERHAVERASLRRAEREHRPHPTQVARVVVVPREVPADDARSRARGGRRRAGRAPPGSTTSAAERSFAVSIQAVLHAASGEPRREDVRRAVELRVVDVDPRPEPLEHRPPQPVAGRGRPTLCRSTQATPSGQRSGEDGEGEDAHRRRSLRGVL